MTFNENKDKMTDRGWNRLYNRLEQDGLILENETVEKKNFLHSVSFRIAAAIAVLCICVAALYTIRNSDVKNATMLTLQNDKGAPTLVKTLEDGSVVYLAEHTALSYPDHFRENKREVYLKGDAFFDVNRNPQKPFIIETNDVIVEVLGTSFNVKSIDEQPFSLSVKTGEVKVKYKKDKQTVNVKAGETVLLQSESFRKLQSDSEDIFSGYNGNIHFKDETLENIVQVINMNSDSVKLNISPELNNRTLTVTFSEDSPSTMAELIAIALNLNINREENMITLSGK